MDAQTVFHLFVDQNKKGRDRIAPVGIDALSEMSTQPRASEAFISKIRQMSYLTNLNNLPQQGLLGFFGWYAGAFQILDGCLYRRE